MIHHRLTLFAVLIFVLTLFPASSYANEAGGGSTGAGHEHNIMDMPGHDMSGHTMEIPNSSITGQEPGAVTEQAEPQANSATDASTGDISDPNMNGMTHEPADMPAHNMDMPDHDSDMVQESNGHQSGDTGHGDMNPSGQEKNRASLLGGFGLINILIVLAAVILKGKSKMGGAV